VNPQHTKIKYKQYFPLNFKNINNHSQLANNTQICTSRWIIVNGLSMFRNGFLQTSILFLKNQPSKFIVAFGFLLSPPLKAKPKINCLPSITLISLAKRKVISPSQQFSISEKLGEFK
jgi:hypothetical protein